MPALLAALLSIRRLQSTLHAPHGHARPPRSACPPFRAATRRRRRLHRRTRGPWRRQSPRATRSCAPSSGPCCRCGARAPGHRAIAGGGGGEWGAGAARPGRARNDSRPPQRCAPGAGARRSGSARPRAARARTALPYRATLPRWSRGAEGIDETAIGGGGARSGTPTSSRPRELPPSDLLPSSSALRPASTKLLLSA